ncbi:MAG: Mur ligase family protein [Wenzhouxiangellaceae bacterium]|nr:Mur ligase family protein [Wenzhouxiangellaceae bacterium]
MKTHPRPGLDEMLRMLDARTPPERIELGLERVRRVFDRLAPDLSGIRVVTVGGTNGKGSTVAFIESIARAAGRTTLAYTSPHVSRFSERFRAAGEPLEDGAIADALAAVEAARGQVDLTWFEHVTLAAFVLAARTRPGWLLLEVGLGGRLDAVNIVDADVAVITSIGMDHQGWLGNTRAEIAREKCGIARRGRPVIVAETRPPPGMLEELAAIGTEIVRAGEHFDWRWRDGRLDATVGDRRFAGLEPGLAGRHQGGNAAAAIAAVLALAPDIGADAVAAGIGAARLPGRFQCIARDPDVIVDVAHNPAAVRKLAAALDRLPGGKLAVFAALGDKDVAGMVRAIDERIECWYLAGLDAPRGLSASELAERAGFRADDQAGAEAGARVKALESVAEALAAARADARADARGACAPGQCVVVFGSFLTAAAAIETMQRMNRSRDGS